MAALLHHRAGRLPTVANYLPPHPRSPQGDSHVVNCLSPHPSHTFVLATSGIDDDIKVWAPSRAERAPPGGEAEDLMRDNLRRQGHPRRQMLVTPEMLQARRPAAPRGADRAQPAGCWARCWHSPQPVSTKRRLPCMQMLLAGRLGVRVRRVFLADGDAMTLPVNRLRCACVRARACVCVGWISASLDASAVLHRAYCQTVLSCLPLPTPHPHHTSTHPSTPAAPALQVDVVIVGAGSAGLSCAYELSKYPDIKVGVGCVQCVQCYHSTVCTHVRVAGRAGAGGGMWRVLQLG